MGTMGLLLLGVGVAAVYFLPGLVAKNRGHHQYAAILVLNLLLGWTFVGWVIALVWASAAVQPRAGGGSVPAAGGLPRQQNAFLVEQLQSLDRAFIEKRLDGEEYRRKRKLLLGE